MRRTTRIAVLLLLLAVTGCASRGTPAVSSGDRNVIDAVQLNEVEGRTTALQLIERLHPSWLRGRGPVGVGEQDAAPLIIYVNNQQLAQGTSQLSRYVAAELREIRYLSAVEATTRFGTGHSSGAILLLTK